MQKEMKWIFVFCLVITGTDVCRSDIKITSADEKGGFARIEITDTITKADVQKFAQLEAALRPIFETIDVELDSPGGDVFAAMQIGEIVRKDWLWTSIPDEPPATGCMSACVLILAAGANRILGDASRVGIHRPYFDQGLFAGLDQTQAKTKYDELSQSVAAYLAKMGMPERLYQEMMKVPSSEIRVLSYDESKFFNLSGEDPGYGEWIRAKNIAKYGKTKMKEFDAWLTSEKEYMTRCTGSSSKFDEKLWLQCAEEFESRFPNPIK
jgi:hypothetical protein